MQRRLYIESFNCLTSTAGNSEAFWEALCKGERGTKLADSYSWPNHIQRFWRDHPYQPFSCRISPRMRKSYLETFSDYLVEVSAGNLEKTSQEKVGIILATTKGAIEDFVWDEHFQHQDVDPLSLVLETTLAKLPERNWVLKQVVSNSCASSHAAFTLAKRWMESGSCEKVLILAGDFIGPFVHTGFQSLKALSSTSVKSFQAERDGLVLGEAFTSILLSHTEGEFELVDAQVFNEAHTITGPSPEGRGLQQCLKNMLPHQCSPDMAIAHGTATLLNDQTEDVVLDAGQKLFDRPFSITATKWSVGHTLGASGSIDVIAALLCLKHQMIFPIPGEKADETFKAQNYHFGEVTPAELHSALITSLGFGGTNGALLVRRSVR